MKKILLGMAAGAMALGAGVAPAFAGGNENDESSDSIWENIEDDTDTVEQLILIAGMANQLDACGNGKPFYTMFVPIDDAADFVIEDILGTSVADLAATPAAVKAILNDHLVNGSFSPWQLEQPEITTLTARSGFVLRNEEGGTINDQPILYSEQACNGFVYFIGGFIDSTPQVPTEGLNSLDTPNDGTPGGSNSLPDTL